MSSVTWTKHVKNSKVSVSDATSFVYPFSKSSRKLFDPLCAGYVAASAGILVGHPLDSMKVHLQTKNSEVNVVVSSRVTSSHMKTSSCGTLAETKYESKKSLRALYAGISGPLLTSGVVASINFALYDTFRRFLYQNEHIENSAGTGNNYLHYDSMRNVAISGAASGAIVSFATSPLIVVKTKQQLMLWSIRKAAKRTLVHQGGFMNFYSGFGAHFLCETIGRGVYYTSYEYFKRLTIRHNNMHIDSSEAKSDSNTTISGTSLISLKERMLCASITGMLTWSVIFPFDVIRSKTYASSLVLSNNSVCPTSSQLAMEVWRKGGFKPYLNPFLIAIARAGPVHAVVLPIYDLTFDWLRS